jgi:hypothetical protein
MLAFSHLFNMGPGCYKLTLLIPDVLVSATSFSAPVPHDPTLLGGSDAICND